MPLANSVCTSGIIAKRRVKWKSEKRLKEHIYVAASLSVMILINHYTFFKLNVLVNNKELAILLGEELL